MTNQGAYIIALVIMVLGLVCAILPFVPGPPVVWLGALFYGWSTDWVGFGWIGLIILLLIMLPTSTSDWWLSALLLKKSGGSPWTMVGSMIGGLLGMFVIPILGILIGSLLGVVAVEWLLHRDIGRMLRSGQGFLVGWLLSTVVEVVGSLAMVALFIAMAR